MNLEEMLRQERGGPAPNPLSDRTDEIVTRVRHHRRARGAAASVVSVGVVAVIALVGGQFLYPDSPAEISPSGPTVSDAVPLSDLPADSPLDPGRYVLSVAEGPVGEALLPLLPVLSVPEGYAGIEGGIGVTDLTDPFGRYVWAWVVGRVYPHPCSAVEFAETVGPSVADLANALAAQALRAGTDPVPVTVGGYDGLYVELSVPDDVNVELCPLKRFNMWPGRWQEAPGQVDMVWIVDVEGQRIVLDASHFPGASSEEVAELRDMVTTATFEPAEGT